MITKKKWFGKLMLIVSIVLIFDSIGTIAEIGPRGLLSILEWTAGSGYIAVFMYMNRWLLDMN